jgi:hypothetical protein
MKITCARIAALVRQEKFIFAVMAATVAAFSLASLFSYQATHWFQAKFFDGRMASVQHGLATDSQYVSEQMKDIAASPAVAALIQAENTTQLFSTLQNEQANHGLTALTVTDANGVVLVRTQATSRKGDYIFQTTAYGRKVAEGIPVISIEQGTALPLLIIAGYPVTNLGKTVGAIFGGYSIDDAYSRAFRAKYLTDGENLVFYSRQDGVVATTFENPDTRSALAADFNTGSDWILQRQSDREVTIEGKVYFVKNIVFPGLDGSPGGVLVLYRSNYAAEAAVLSLIVAIIFALIIFFFHTRAATKRRRREEVSILVVCSIVIFLASYSVDLGMLHAHLVSVEKPSSTIYNATLRIDPSSAIWDRSSEQQVAVKVSTGGEAINAAQIDVVFDPATVNVVDIDTTGSVCAPTMILQKNIDNAHGEAQIMCALPSPGFSGPNGTVATLVLQPIQSGNATLHFATSTQILADDGLGTDVLRLATDGAYRIVATSTKGGASSTLIFSPTYPNSARWYNNPNGLFAWVAIPGYAYHYGLNGTSVMTTLGNASTTVADSVSYSGLADGVHYFHVQPVKGNSVGAVSNYAVMIDTTPPERPTVKASEATVSAGEVIRLTFESKDSLSGLQSNYYVRFDDGIFLPAASPLSIALPQGRHVITVRAFDRAGNFSDGSIAINVTGQ